MERSNKISKYQALLLFTIFRIMTGLTYMPIMNIVPANQDMWFVYLLSILYTIIFSLPLLYLSNKLDGLNLIQYIKKTMGKFLATIIGSFYCIFLFLNYILFITVLVEILDSALFPENPTWVTASIILITCVYIANKGLRNIARLGEFIVPLILTVFLILIILGYKNYDPYELLPILRDSTFKDINMGAISIGIRHIEIIVLAMMAHQLERKKDLNKIFLRSLVYSVIVSILIVIAAQLTLGIEFAKHTNFPFLTFARLIIIGQNIQGFDSLYIISWTMGNVIKISGYFYIITAGFGEIFHRKNQDFIIPISILGLLVVLLIKDRRPVLAVKEPIQQFMHISSFIAIVVIPIIILIVNLFRRKNLNQ